MLPPLWQPGQIKDREARQHDIYRRKKHTVKNSRETPRFKIIRFISILPQRATWLTLSK